MSENEIKDVLLRNGLNFVEQGSIWGVIKPSMGAYHNGIGEIMHTMKDHVLHFNQEGIAILAVDDMNGLLKEDTLLFIPKTKIISSSIKMKLFKLVLTICTNQGTIEYKIRKSILACPWHKENLSFMLLHLAQGKKA